MKTAIVKGDRCHSSQLRWALFQLSRLPRHINPTFRPRYRHNRLRHCFTSWGQVVDMAVEEER